MASSNEAYSGLWESLKAELPRLEAALPSIRVEGAGHFPYYERPGCVRAGLERLRMAGTT
jgi:hypothetical protein